MSNIADREYTLVAKDRIFKMTPDGFFLNIDIAYGEDTIEIKLVPGDISEPVDFSREPCIVIKQPHPKIENFKIVDFKKIEVPQKVKDRLSPMLKERFEKFKRENRYFLLPQKIGENYYGGTTVEELSFSPEPLIDLYVSQDPGYRLVSASWSNDAGEMGCCISGLFQLTGKRDKFSLDELIPLEEAKGVGGIKVKLGALINHRKFVFVDMSGWEWGREVAYEIK